MKKSHNPNANWLPENRTGTRSHRKYSRYNGQSGLALAAKPKHWSAALAICGARETSVKKAGRVVGRLVRDMRASMYDQIEDNAYGNWSHHD